MVIQVITLMPLRTVMNYQYKNGLAFQPTISHLFKDGGMVRFYRGVGPALIQGPLARFGDTASNVLALQLLADLKIPVGLKTLMGSLLSGSFRVLLVPIDTVKTIMQVEGKNGLGILRQRIQVNGPMVLFSGAGASASATAIGHYPWFATYNTLQELIPKYTDMKYQLARNAAIGFTCSIISDSVSNGMRVLKTFKQTSTTSITYPQAVREIIE